MRALRGSAGERWTEALCRFEHLLPLYPGTNVVATARIPPPPALVTGTELQQTLQLVRSYYACKAHHFRGPTPRGVSVKDAQPLVGTLAPAVQWLAQSKTQPIVWCSWVMRSWSLYGPPTRRKRSPPIRYVYSKKTIARREEFFSWDGNQVFGSRLVFTSAHRELIRRFTRLRQEIHQLKVLDEAGVQRALVATHLTPAEYKRAVREANNEAAFKQAQIDEMVRKGSYLWG